MDSGGFSIGTGGSAQGMPGIQAIIDNNTFVNQVGPAITNWVSYSPSQTVVEGNNFLNTDRVALALAAGYPDTAIAASSDYFGTTDPATIASMVTDRSDGFQYASYINTTPFLSSPNLAAPQYVLGTPSNDIFIAGSANAFIDGGAGINAVVFSGPSTQYTVTLTLDDLYWIISDNVPNQNGTMTLTNVEFAEFTDKTIALVVPTVPLTSVQQEIFGLYAALYNRATDFGGFSYWAGVVGQQSDGSGVTTANAGTTAVTLNDAAVLGQLFVNTQATYFNATYGGLIDSDFITDLYINLAGNAVNIAPAIAYWGGLLQTAEAAGQSVQAARAGLVGQIVHDMIDYNVNIVAPGYTAAQWQVWCSARRPSTTRLWCRRPSQTPRSNRAATFLLCTRLTILLSKRRLRSFRE